MIFVNSKLKKVPKFIQFMLEDQRDALATCVATSLSWGPEGCAGSPGWHAVQLNCAAGLYSLFLAFGVSADRMRGTVYRAPDDRL